jgi:hypothetical protein
MAVSNHWRHVDHFTVSQAAALWCDCEPVQNTYFERHHPAGFLAMKQALTGSIQAGELRARNIDAARLLNDYSQSTIERSDLIAWAESKSLRPAFLFDTLLPIVSDALDCQAMSPPPATGLVTAAAAEKNKGGRPPEYDWNAMIHEIIRIADMDNLPKTRADLVRRLQAWFENVHGKAPAESELKKRVSAIYNALEKTGWESKDGG